MHSKEIIVHLFSIYWLLWKLSKVRPPKEFSKVAMTNACILPTISSDKFVMKSKTLDLDKIYNFSFNEKIVTPKHLPLQAFVIATLENSFERSTLAYWIVF